MPHSLLFLTAGVAVVISALDVQQAIAQTPLSTALRRFQESAARDPIGREEAPLTEEEVIAAIRRTARPDVDPEVSPELFTAFQQIAVTGTLPTNAAFESLNSYDLGGDYVYDVWSVRIRMSRPDGSSYAFVLRERTIRSRTLTEELARQEELVKALFDRSDNRPLPVGSGPRSLVNNVESLKARIAKQQAR